MKLIACPGNRTWSILLWCERSMVNYTMADFTLKKLDRQIEEMEAKQKTLKAELETTRLELLQLRSWRAGYVHARQEAATEDKSDKDRIKDLILESLARTGDAGIDSLKKSAMLEYINKHMPEEVSGNYLGNILYELRDAEQIVSVRKGYWSINSEE